MVVKHRHVQAKIYRKTKRYPFYRLAYTAEGKRIVRSFKTYNAARTAAKRVVRQIAKGNELAATLTSKEAHSYRFAIAKLRGLAGDLNCRKTDMTAPDVVFSLEDAIVEFVEAKRALGGSRLAEAVTGFLSTISKVRRVKVRDAVEELLREREAKTKPEKEGARPQLSPKMAFQDRSRMRPFMAAFQMDVCDFRPEHFDLFFREHLRGLVAKTRNGYACCRAMTHAPLAHRNPGQCRHRAFIVQKETATWRSDDVWTSGKRALPKQDHSVSLRMSQLFNRGETGLETSNQ